MLKKDTTTGRASPVWGALVLILILLSLGAGIGDGTSILTMTNRPPCMDGLHGPSFAPPIKQILVFKCLEYELLHQYIGLVANAANADFCHTDCTIIPLVVVVFKFL
jgi:hypothetical protein